MHPMALQSGDQKVPGGPKLSFSGLRIIVGHVEKNLKFFEKTDFFRIFPFRIPSRCIFLTKTKGKKWVFFKKNFFLDFLFLEIFKEKIVYIDRNKKSQE